MSIIQRPNLLKYRFSLHIYVQTLLYCKVYEIKIERNFYKRKNFLHISIQRKSFGRNKHVSMTDE